MPTTRLVLLLAVLATGRAQADDRGLVIDVGAGVGASDVSATASSVTTGRITLGWEHAPLPLPATKGYAFGGALVPELVAGTLVGSDRAAGFIGAGLRAELRMAQRNMGLLEVTARGAVYLALRGLVVGDQREPMMELGLGEYFLRHHNWTRIGFELDLITHPTTDPSAFDVTNPVNAQSLAVLVQLYVGWAP